MTTLSRIVLALLLFQIALMGLLTNDLSGVAISANQLKAMMGSNPIKAGQEMPSFGAYGHNGTSVRVLQSRKPSILVFATCQCQISSAEAITGNSTSSNFQKALFLAVPPAQLDKLCRENSWNAPAFAMRLNEMTSLVRGYKPPVIVYVSQHGVALSVRGASSAEHNIEASEFGS